MLKDVPYLVFCMIAMVAPVSAKLFFTDSAPLPALWETVPSLIAGFAGVLLGAYISHSYKHAENYNAVLTAERFKASLRLLQLFQELYSSINALQCGAQGLKHASDASENDDEDALGQIRDVESLLNEIDQFLGFNNCLISERLYAEGMHQKVILAELKGMLKPRPEPKAEEAVIAKVITHLSEDSALALSKCLKESFPVKERISYVERSARLEIVTKAQKRAKDLVQEARKELQIEI